MTQSKKYDYRISQSKKTWAAEIVRRVTSKRTSVSKSQDGFASEVEAKTWAETELKLFLENLVNRNKRDSVQHMQDKKAKESRETAYKQRKKDMEKAKLEDTDSEESHSR